MRSILLLWVISLSWSSAAVSQTALGSDRIIVIPVVVHVVYNNAHQNISNEQVLSQIAVLNRDYRRKNADTLNTPHVYKDLAADARIEFRLAGIDQAGQPTTGIQRIRTDVTVFGVDDLIKSSATGGADPWDRNKYLNIWVGNLADGVMGYSSIPGDSPERDGVVIRYAVFGTTVNVKSPYNKGRTAVHEIGHWLGLRHLWGDVDCGDDLIDDTPAQKGPTRGCPTGSRTSCGTSPGGDMYMNFMDFTNDACTNMFTAGQVNKMRALFVEGGARAALLASETIVSREPAVEDNGSGRLVVYPNPARDMIFVRMPVAPAALTATSPATFPATSPAPSDVPGNFSAAAVLAAPERGHLMICNQMGQMIRRISYSGITISVPVQDLSPGIYYLVIDNPTGLKQVVRFIKSTY